MILFRCTCGRKLRLRPEHAGRTGRCPGCGERFQVPDDVGDGRREAELKLAPTPAKPKPEPRRPAEPKPEPRRAAPAAAGSDSLSLQQTGRRQAADPDATAIVGPPAPTPLPAKAAPAAAPAPRPSAPAGPWYDNQALVMLLFVFVLPVGLIGIMQSRRWATGAQRVIALAAATAIAVLVAWGLAPR